MVEVEHQTGVGLMERVSDEADGRDNKNTDAERDTVLDKNRGRKLGQLHNGGSLI